MPTWSIFLIVAVFLVMDGIVVFALMHAMGGMWRDLARGFTTLEPLPGAVRRDFQSIRIGLFNMGGCVHLAVDENAIHFYPTKILRMLAAQPFSVPWESVTLEAPAKGSLAKIRIGRTVITGPAWAFSLAAGTDAPARSGAGA